MADASAPISPQTPVWKLDFLTVVRCRLLLAAVLALSFVSNLLYLHSARVVDLSGDEAQYWDWSRHLDLSYYSKGPLIAYIIRGSVALFGATMPAVRYPALLLSLGTSIFTYLLTRRLFGSERLALGSVLLFGAVPMFIAGGVLMTIDPPMFMCWAAATYFAACALFPKPADIVEHKPMICWLLVGIAIGIGFLAKYAEFLWFIGLFGFSISKRRRLAPAVFALAVASVFTLPVLIWNHRHNWVSLRHVARQTGAQSGTFALGNVLEMIGGQIGIVGPTMAVLMTAAIVFTLRRRKLISDASNDGALFLIWIGVPFFLINLLASLRAKIQLNWPAPAYFTLTILVAWFIARKLATPRGWRPWRVWFWATVIIGLLVMPIAHDTTLLYPLLQRFTKHGTREMEAIDPLARLRGWRELGQHVAAIRQSSPTEPFVMCDDYQQTAELAFYLPDQPATYCAGPYFGKRLSQYDMWPDHRLDPTSPLVGRDAIYLGKGGTLPPEVSAAFASVEKLPAFPIYSGKTLVRTFKLWRCNGFKGMQAPQALPDY